MPVTIVRPGAPRCGHGLVEGVAESPPACAIAQRVLKCGDASALKPQGAKIADARGGETG
jgi:hypothetical protein